MLLRFFESDVKIGKHETLISHIKLKILFINRSYHSCSCLTAVICSLDSLCNSIVFIMVIILYSLLTVDGLRESLEDGRINSVCFIWCCTRIQIWFYAWHVVSSSVERGVVNNERVNDNHCNIENNHSTVNQVIVLLRFLFHSCQIKFFINYKSTSFNTSLKFHKLSFRN